MGNRQWAIVSRSPHCPLLIAATEGHMGARHPLVIVNTGNGKGKSTAAFGVVMRAWGRGWTWTSKDLDQTAELAREGWRLAQPYLTSGDYDLVVLDELTYAFKFGWVPLGEVLEALRNRHERTHVIITGR